MMMVAIVSLVIVAVLIPLTAIVGAVYAGWLAEQAGRARGEELRDVDPAPAPRRRLAAQRLPRRPPQPKAMHPP